MNCENEMRMRDLHKLAYTIKHNEEKRVRRLARNAYKHGCKPELLKDILFEAYLLRKIGIGELLESEKKWKYAFYNERD